MKTTQSIKWWQMPLVKDIKVAVGGEAAFAALRDLAPQVQDFGALTRLTKQVTQELFADHKIDVLNYMQELASAKEMTTTEYVASLFPSCEKQRWVTAYEVLVQSKNLKKQGIQIIDGTEMFKDISQQGRALDVVHDCQDTWHKIMIHVITVIMLSIKKQWDDVPF